MNEFLTGGSRVGREQFRRACEAMHVLGLPFEQRKPYLALVEQHREAKKHES